MKKALKPVEVVKDHVDTVEVSRRARHLVPASVQRKFAKGALKVAENSPSLLFAGGVTAGVAGAVLACKATLKAPLLVNDFKQTREDITTEITVNATYTEKERRRDLTVLYLQTSVKFAKLYGPSFILGVTSVACLTGSHRILGNRYAAMSAAYTGVVETFEQYRGRVREDAGDEKDREYRYGKKTVTETVDTPNGPKKVKKTVADLDGDTSMYARLWAKETSEYWKSHGDSNKAFLQITESWANDKLRAQGYLFLNEVYKMLGLKPTSIGQFVGWVYGKQGRDNYVDFGLHKDNIGVAQFFEDGMGGVWLDFNVDGRVVEELDHLERY